PGDGGRARRRPLRRGLRLLQVVAGQDPRPGPLAAPQARCDPERGGRSSSRRGRTGRAARLLALRQRGRRALLGRCSRRAARASPAMGTAAARRIPRLSGPHGARVSLRRPPPGSMGEAPTARPELRGANTVSPPRTSARAKRALAILIGGYLALAVVAGAPR